MARPGRPKGTNNKEITISMRVDQKTAKRLQAYCEKMNIKKSEALRQAIDLMAGKE